MSRLPILPRLCRLAAGSLVVPLAVTATPAAAEPLAEPEVRVLAESEEYLARMDWQDGELHLLFHDDASGDQVIGVVDPATGTERSRVAVPEAWRTSGLGQTLTAASDGSYYLTGGAYGEYGVAHLGADGTATPPAPLARVRPGYDLTTSLALAPDEQTVYVGGYRYLNESGTRSRHEVATMPADLPVDQNTATPIAGLDIGGGYDPGQDFPPFDGHPAMSSFLHEPGDMVARGSAVYVANNRSGALGTMIQRIDVDAGTVTTVVGNVYDDGGARPAEGMNARTPWFQLGEGLAVDRARNVFFTDAGPSGYRVWRADGDDGELHLLAGGGDQQPGPGVTATDLDLLPRALDVDRSGTSTSSPTGAIRRERCGVAC